MNDINNCTSISAISIFAKIKEKPVHNQLYFHLIENDLMRSSQHGFRRNHCTVTELLKITSLIDQYWPAKWSRLSGSQEGIRYGWLRNVA